MKPPLFSPASTFWRVNREVAVSLAGPRAVLMQIAHPLVAAGVAEHSKFREHRLGRLFRTSMAAAAITFGSRDFALRAVRAINRRHESVNGVLRAQAGMFPAGTPYDANDPVLKLWVLSTITDSTFRVYDLFVRPLSRSERESYYRDSLIAAALFGIPEAITPATYDAFERYMEAMLDGGAITVSDDSRRIVDALFAPCPTGIALLAGSAIGIGLLPERLRREFGFRWTPRRERWLTRAAALSRLARKAAPDVLCTHPAATLAARLAPAQ